MWHRREAGYHGRAGCDTARLSVPADIIRMLHPAGSPELPAGTRRNASPLTGPPCPPAQAGGRACWLAYGTGANQIRVPQLLLVSLGCGAVYSEAM
jgi:hypothetical protein